MNKNKLQVFTLTVAGKCAFLRHEDEKETQALHPNDMESWIHFWREVSSLERETNFHLPPPPCSHFSHSEIPRSLCTGSNLRHTPARKGDWKGEPGNLKIYFHGKAWSHDTLKVLRFGKREVMVKWWPPLVQKTRQGSPAQGTLAVCLCGEHSEPRSQDQNQAGLRKRKERTTVSWTWVCLSLVTFGQVSLLVEMMCCLDKNNFL